MVLLNNKKLDEGKSIFKDLQDLYKVIFVETNPGPVKYAAELMGLMSRRMRLPMVSPEPENLEKIKNVIRNLGLI